MALLMLRHGMVPKGQESGNPHLTSAGRHAAIMAAERLKDAPIDHIYSSPEKRAVETAKIWSARSGVPMSVHPELDSWNLGAFKGKHSAGADAVVKRLIDHPEQHAPGGGESAHQYWGRLLPFLAPLLLDGKLHGVVNHSRGLKSLEAYVRAGGEGMDKASWGEKLTEPGEAILVDQDGARNA